MNKFRKNTGPHTERAQQVGALLKRKRKYAKLSMRDLAERMDVQHTTIDKIEKVERELGLLEFICYCQTLGLSEVEVFREVSKLYHDNPEPV